MMIRTSSSAVGLPLLTLLSFHGAKVMYLSDPSIIGVSVSPIVFFRAIDECDRQPCRPLPCDGGL